MGAPAPPIHDTWRANLPEEVRFWDDYVRTRGLQWPDEFRMRIDPAAPLDETEILRRLPDHDPIRILDVGAGPLTTLGKRVEGRRIEITPVDPLAEQYAALLERHGVIAPVATRRCEGEALATCFAPDAFDFAYARNALDHSHDPRAAIEQMVRVVKPGGFVILRHRPNEAVGAGYAGLHQWNFELRRGAFWIWNDRQRHDMHAALAGRADVACHRDGEWLVCVLRKRSSAARESDASPPAPALGRRIRDAIFRRK